MSVILCWLLCANVVLWAQLVLIWHVRHRVRRLSRRYSRLQQRMRLLDVSQQGRVSRAVSVASQAVCALSRIGVPHGETPVPACEPRERHTDARSLSLLGWYARQRTLHAQLAVDLAACCDEHPFIIALQAKQEVLV